MPRVARRTHPQAGRLRRGATDAERKFWMAVRNRQLGGLKFRRQVSIGPYIADFACVEARLIVELDGSQHADAAAYDARRTRYLEAQGYGVMRFSNHDALTNFEAMLEMVLTAASPRPPAGEGGARREAVEGEGVGATCAFRSTHGGAHAS